MANAATIERAVANILRGRLVAFPTETVYGLGADARNPEAVAALYGLKGRPSSHPLIVHLAWPEQADTQAIRELLEQWAIAVPEQAIALAQAFWPGPLTMILCARADAPRWVTGGQDSIGLRAPAHPLAQALLRRFASQAGSAAGIAAPSANRYGAVSPTSAQHVLDEFGDSLILLSDGSDSELPTNAAGYVLDGGAATLGLESTIVDLTGPESRILRPGSITAEQLTQVLGCTTLTDALSNRESTEIAPPRVPGSTVAHYAPRTPVVAAEESGLAENLASLLEAHDPPEQIAVLGRDSLLGELDANPAVHRFALGESPEEQAHRLFATMREADSSGASVMLIALPLVRGLGDALRDRILRAAAANIDPNL